MAKGAKNKEESQEPTQSRNRRNTLINQDLNDYRGHMGAKNRSQWLRLLVPTPGLLAGESRWQRGRRAVLGTSSAQMVNLLERTQAPYYKHLLLNNLQKGGSIDVENEAILLGFFTFSAAANHPAPVGRLNRATECGRSMADLTCFRIAVSERMLRRVSVVTADDNITRSEVGAARRFRTSTPVSR
jgi:hypothetical protein